MKTQIKNRFSGTLIFEADVEADTPVSRLSLAVKLAVKAKADLSGADLSGADLRGANIRGADLSGADLSGADLRGANIRGADLSGVDLRGANLRGANLRGANLRGANIRGADLSGADLRGANLILCGARFDGYEFFAHMRGGALWIKAGCRYFTITDARKHWRETRGGTQLGEESLQICRNAEALAKIRGWTK